MDITVVEIRPTGEFGGHVFEYESDTDLFKCVNPGCGIYEVVARADARKQGIGEITTCPAEAAANNSSGTASEPVTPENTHGNGARTESRSPAFDGCPYGCDDGDDICDGACMGG